MSIQLTQIERLILVNQYEILKNQNTDDEFLVKQYENYIKILQDGYAPLYSDIFSVVEAEEDETTFNETVEILEMFRFLKQKIKCLTEEQRQEIKIDKLDFEGFDANNDDHYFVYKFLVEDYDRFIESKLGYYNSHTQSSLMRYNRMLPVYHKYRDYPDEKAYEIVKDFASVIY